MTGMTRAHDYPGQLGSGAGGLSRRAVGIVEQDPRHVLMVAGYRFLTQRRWKRRNIPTRFSGRLTGSVRRGILSRCW